MMINLTPEEESAVRILERLAKRWPSRLWLFSASGSLHVMLTGEDGEHVHVPGGGVDPAYIVTTIRIPNDGGEIGRAHV